MVLIKICAAAFWTALYLGVVYQILVSNKNWESKLFWLLFIQVPVAGPVIYALAGVDYRREAVRKRLHAHTLELFQRQSPPEMQEAIFSDKGLDRVNEFFRPLARMLRNMGEGNKVYEGTSFEIITSGLRKRELLIQDLRSAQKFIHIEYFKFGADKAGREIRQILMEKAAQGVEVRYIRNNLSNNISIRDKYFREMEAAGIEVKRYTHIRYGLRTFIMRINHQQHRKIVVVDGKVAYTGGMNLNDNYFYRWRDTHLRISGPVVARLQASFIYTWCSCKGSLTRPLSWYFPLDLSTSPAPYQDKLMQVITDAAEFPWPATQFSYEWILHNARKYVYLQTPYFMPPDGFLEALKSAALRGVDVRVMLPRKVDTPLIGPTNRAYYEECLAAGVKLYERDGSFIHSKTLVADDYLTIIGASNLDVRSFSLNSEVNSLVYDEETAQACKDSFLKDNAEATELDLHHWQSSRGFWTDLGSRALRLLYKNL